jgi:hypothetical protein
MTNALQIKLLIAILAVLTVIAGVVVNDHRAMQAAQRKHDEMMRTDPVMQQRFRNFVAPSKKPYLIP